MTFHLLVVSAEDIAFSGLVEFSKLRHSLGLALFAAIRCWLGVLEQTESRNIFRVRMLYTNTVSPNKHALVWALRFRRNQILEERNVCA